MSQPRRLPTVRLTPCVLAFIGLTLAGCTPRGGHLWLDRKPIQPGSLGTLEGVYIPVGEHRQCFTPDGTPCRVSFADAIGDEHHGSRHAQTDTAARLEVRVLDPHHVAVSVRSGGRPVYEEVLRGEVGPDGYFNLATESRAQLTPALVAWTLRRSFSRLGQSDAGDLLLERDVSAILFVTVMPAFGGWDVSSYSFTRISPDV